MASADIFSLSLFEAVFQYAYNIKYVEASIFLMYVQLTETIFPLFAVITRRMKVLSTGLAWSAEKRRENTAIMAAR
jgi:hypothetical protein